MTIQPNKFIFLLLLAMAAVVGITAPDGLAADWTIESPDPAHMFTGDSNHGLARGNDGSIYIAYGSKNLYLAKKTPGNPEWSMEIVDPGSQVGSYASLALDSNGHPHISYQDAANQKVKYARYDGSVWHIEVADAPGGHPGRGISIALDSNDRPHIVHYESYYKRLYHVHFDGSAWLRTYIGFLNANTYWLRPSIALDSNDHPHVVCGQYSSSSGQNLRHYYYNGSSWNNEIVLSGTGVVPSIAIDGDNHIHVAYSGILSSTRSGLGYAHYDGSVWQTGYISPATDRINATAIALDEYHRPHIAYQDTNAGLSLKAAGHDGSAWQIQSINAEGGTGLGIAAGSGSTIHVSAVINNQLRYSSDQGGTWSTRTLDYSGTNGKSTSIAIDSADRPHISHFSPTSRKLRYTRYDGSGFVTDIVDPADLPTMEWNSSLALDSNNHPHIIYYNSENGSHLLNYARHDGTGWNLENVGDGYYYMSVAVDGNDRPHICHIAPFVSLNYAVYNGMAWQTETLETNTSTPHCPSMALDSGNRPHIVYLDRGSVEFRYGFFDGINWNFETLSPASSNSTLFKTASIDLDSLNRPHVCWTDAARVNYAYHDGAKWNIQTSIDTGANYLDMALDSADHPHISYFNANGADLKYAVYDGMAWQIQTVDAAGNVGQYTSIAIDSRDTPHISYYDDTNAELKYATPVADFCMCDIDTSGKCDLQDIQLFSSIWGRENCPGCGCDINGDGDCDGSDLFSFAADWERSDCR